MGAHSAHGQSVALAQIAVENLAVRVHEISQLTGHAANLVLEAVGHDSPIQSAANAEAAMKEIHDEAIPHILRRLAGLRADLVDYGQRF